MKARSMAAALCSAALVVTAIALVTTGVPVGKADCPGDPGTACGNGDVNADGAIDIGDAIYLLSYLFAQGPAPHRCPAGPPPSGGALAATGQTRCYDGDGAAPDCSDPAYPGEDGFYQKGCSGAGRFVDNGDGTVTDHCTDLMWKQDLIDANGDGRVTSGDTVSWQLALQRCEDLEFAGYGDWRLPNVRELQSIVDYGRSDSAIDSEVLHIGSWCWSSSTYVGHPYFVWYVRFDKGVVDIEHRTNAHFASAVRDAH